VREETLVGWTTLSSPILFSEVIWHGCHIMMRLTSCVGADVYRVVIVISIVIVIVTVTTRTSVP
jgi:hypothetical protein